MRRPTRMSCHLRQQAMSFSCPHQTSIRPGSSVFAVSTHQTKSLQNRVNRASAGSSVFGGERLSRPPHSAALPPLQAPNHTCLPPTRGKPPSAHVLLLSIANWTKCKKGTICGRNEIRPDSGGRTESLPGSAVRSGRIHGRRGLNGRNELCALGVTSCAATNPGRP